MKKFLIKSLPQIICVLSIFVWVISSIFNSIENLLKDNVSNTTMACSFIIASTSAIYLIGKNLYIKRKLKALEPKVNKPDGKSCKKCGQK